MTCKCGHPWAAHQAPGTECVRLGCRCGLYRAVREVKEIPPDTDECDECGHTRGEHLQGAHTLGCHDATCGCRRFIERNGQPSNIFNPPPTRRGSAAMSKTDFTSIGQGVVVHVTKKAALVNLKEHGEKWVPFSALSTTTLSSCKPGETIESVRVETWWADKL